MKKKAISTMDFFLWIGKLLLLLLMLISVYFIARIYQQQERDTAEIEAGLFRDYMLYSPHALSFRDVNSGRLLPGVIDVANMDSDRLEAAANFGKKNSMVAASITLMDSAGTNAVKQVYYNKQAYDDWLPLTVGTFLGAGTVFKDDKSLYVIYVDSQGKTQQGVLKTEVLVPRT